MPKPTDPQAKRDPLEKFDRAREPGQGLREKVTDIFQDASIAFGYIWGMLFAWVILEILHGYFRWPAHPVIAIVGASVGAGASFLWLRKKALSLRTWHAGFRGEQAVGQYLQRHLEPLGYHVFHDVEIKTIGNIDHVVVGPAGVFAIETKYRTKPARKARISYDGNRLTIDDRTVTDFEERNPIQQVIAAATALHKLIRERTGNDIWVMPILNFPGWWVTGSPNHDVWVINPERIPKELPRLPRKLDPETIATVARALQESCRAS